ncbi:MAG: hypothetical protein KBD63_01895, partial [Bacteriovoracaceae bacterium]|nr:hypothetical protein [Bacteriovoracaceae bacterium]
MTSISNYSEAKYAPVRVSFIFILLFNFVLESCLKSSVSYSDKNESVNTDVDFCGGSGTVSDPYLICDQASLVELQNKFLNTPDYILYADKYYKQTSDITLTGNTLDVIGASIENNFNTSTPSVAPTSKPFNGSYDGNNKSISAFSLSKSASDYNALFRHLGSLGIIKNLILHTPTLSLT